MSDFFCELFSTVLVSLIFIFCINVLGGKDER